MIRDAKLIYSNAQALTVTADSTNILDHGAKGDAIGEGNLDLVIQANGTFTGTGTTTITFALIVSADEAYTTPITLFSKTVAEADFAANQEFVKTKLPYGMLRYSKLTYTVANGPAADGTIDAFLTPNADVMND